MAAIETWSPSASHFSVARDVERQDAISYDCITCATSGQKCDRRQPTCDVCASQSRQCEGFALDLVWKDAMTPKKKRNPITCAAKKAPESICNVSQTHKKQRTKELKFVTAQVGSKKRKKSKASYAKGSDAGLFSKFTLGTEPRTAAAESSAMSPTAAGGSTASESTKSSHGSPRDAEESEQWDQSSWAMTSTTLPLYGGFVFPPEQLPAGFFQDGHQGSLEPYAADCLPQLSEGLSPASTSPAYSGLDVTGYGDPVEVEDDILEILRQVPTGVTYQSLAHKYQDILESCKLSRVALL